MFHQTEEHEANLRRLRGRVARSRSIGTKLTPDEEQRCSVETACAIQGFLEFRLGERLRLLAHPQADRAVEAVREMFGHAFDSRGERCHDFPLTPEEIVAAVRRADAKERNEAGSDWSNS